MRVCVGVCWVGAGDHDAPLLMVPLVLHDTPHVSNPPCSPRNGKGASPNHLRTLFHRHTPPRARTCTYPRPQCRFMCAEREDGWGWVAGDIVPVTNSERMFVIFVALLGMAHRTMEWSNRCTKASKGIGPALH